MYAESNWMFEFFGLTHYFDIGCNFATVVFEGTSPVQNLVIGAQKQPTADIHFCCRKSITVLSVEQLLIFIVFIVKPLC